MMKIIGIDPGSRITGYGIINSDKQRYSYVASGCVRITAEKLGDKLQQIFASLSEVLSEYCPAQAAIEQVFMHRNANSALKLGQARGAAIVALAYHGLDVAEYSARQIKQAAVGYGAADKEQVQYMVKRLLNVNGDIQEDAADALAVAICHAHSSTMERCL